MPSFFRDYHTESAGTAIVEVIPGITNMIARINEFEYVSPAGSHTMTILKCNATTVTTAAATASDIAIEVADLSPGAIPTTGVEEALGVSDYIVYKDSKGVWYHEVLTGASSPDLQVAGGIQGDIDSGSTIYCFYELARPTHDAITFQASSTTTVTGPIQAGYVAHKSGFTSRSGVGDPLIVSINNTGADGYLTYLHGNWTDSSNVVSG